MSMIEERKSEKMYSCAHYHGRDKNSVHGELSASRDSGKSSYD